MNNGNIAHHYFGTHLANYPWRIIKFVFCNKMDFATNTKSWISILSFLTFILLKDLQFMMSDSAAVHWLAGNSDFCNLYLQKLVDVSQVSGYQLVIFLSDFFWHSFPILNIIVKKQHYQQANITKPMLPVISSFGYNELLIYNLKKMWDTWQLRLCQNIVSSSLTLKQLLLIAVVFNMKAPI